MRLVSVTRFGWTKSLLFSVSCHPQLRYHPPPLTVHKFPFHVQFVIPFSPLGFILTRSFLSLSVLFFYFMNHLYDCQHFFFMFFFLAPGDPCTHLSFLLSFSCIYTSFQQLLSLWPFTLSESLPSFLYSTW